MLLPFYLKIQLVNYHCSCLSPQWRIQRGSLLRSPVPCHSREHVNYNRLEGEVPKQDFRWPAEYRSSGIILCWPEISAAQGSCGAWGPPVCKQGLSVLLEDIWTQQLLLGKWEESDAECGGYQKCIRTSPTWSGFSTWCLGPWPLRGSALQESRAANTLFHPLPSHSPGEALLQKSFGVCAGFPCEGIRN